MGIEPTELTLRSEIAPDGGLSFSHSDCAGLILFSIARLGAGEAVRENPIASPDRGWGMKEVIAAHPFARCALAMRKRLVAIGSPAPAAAVFITRC